MKDKALKLALEGAANYIDALGGDSRKYRQALAAPVGHRDGHWCADLTCKKCYSADFRLKHTTPPAQPAPVLLTEMAKTLVDRLGKEQAVYLSMETAKSFVKSMLANAPEKGQP